MLINKRNVTLIRRELINIFIILHLKDVKLRLLLRFLQGFLLKFLPEFFIDFHQEFIQIFASKLLHGFNPGFLEETTIE